MGNPTERRRAPKTLTARAKSALACRRHLRDLKEAHGTPPADVAVSEQLGPGAAGR